MSDSEKKVPMRRMTVTIPDELVAGLEDLASISGASVSDTLREIVTQHLFNTHWKGVGDIAMAAIKSGATNDEALARVFEVHPGAAATLRSISWYRSRMRSEDQSIMTDAEVKRARERAGG